jgi:hypothetical protein
VAAWVIAGGLALSYQYYRNKGENATVMSAAEVEAWNATKKAASLRAKDPVPK